MTIKREFVIGDTVWYKTKYPKTFIEAKVTAIAYISIKTLVRGTELIAKVYYLSSGVHLTADQIEATPEELL